MRLGSEHGRGEVHDEIIVRRIVCDIIIMARKIQAEILTWDRGTRKPKYGDHGSESHRQQWSWSPGMDYNETYTEYLHFRASAYHSGASQEVFQF